MPVSVILLGHKAQVGKDTLGEYLVQELGYVRFGFADKLKEVVADLYDFSHEQMYGELKNIPDPRYTKSRESSEILPFSEKYINDKNRGCILRSGWYNEDGSRHTEGKEAFYRIFNSYTPREILQDFGQEQRKRFPDIWADYVMRSIADHLDPEDNVIELAGSPGFVITDFRFPNEAVVAKRYCDELSGVSRFSGEPKVKLVQIKITRPDEYRGVFSGSTNISETALDHYDEWDYQIHNDGSIQELYEWYTSLGI